MKFCSSKTTFLCTCSILLTTLEVFSQATFDEYKITGPMQLLFKDLHEQENLTPSQKLNRKAVESMGKQDWKNTFGFLMEAMKADPNSAETYINFGVAHFMREEYPSSEKALLKALEVDAKNAKALYHYSRVMVLKGERELALEAATKAVTESQETEWKYLQWIGELKIEESAYQAAADSFSKALEILREKVALVDNAIKNEESKQEVAETYTDVEIVTSQSGAAREVQVQKYRYDYKEAPEEWHQFKASLESQIADLQQQKEEALKALNS